MRVNCRAQISVAFSRTNLLKYSLIRALYNLKLKRLGNGHRNLSGTCALYVLPIHKLKVTMGYQTFNIAFKYMRTAVSFSFL